MTGIEKDFIIRVPQVPSTNTNDRTAGVARQVVPMPPSGQPSGKVDTFKVDYETKLFELAKKEGFNNATDFINEKYPDLAGLSIAEQYNKILELSGQTAQPETVEAKDDRKEQKSVTYREFETLSKQEKIEVLFEELARNEFLCGDANNKKAAKEWDALPNEQKQQFIAEIKAKAIEAIKEKLQGKVSSEAELEKAIVNIFGDGAIDKGLNKGLIYLRTATFNGFDIKSFLKQEKSKIEDDIHFEIANRAEDEELTDEQVKFCKENKNFSTALLYVESKRTGEFSETEANLKPSQIKAKLQSLGMNPLEVMIYYYKDQQDKGLKLPDGVDIEELEAQNASYKIIQQYKLDDTSQVDAFMQSDTFNNSNWSNLSSDAQSDIVINYVKQNYSDLSPEEFSKKAFELLVGLNQSNTQLPGTAFLAHKKLLKDLTPEQARAFAETRNIAAQSMNAVNINNFAPENITVHAQTVNGLHNENPEAAETIAQIGLNTSTDQTFEHLSPVYAVSPSFNTQYAAMNRVLAVKDEEIQAKTASDTNKSSLAIRRIFSLRTHELMENNQAKIHAVLIEDKNVALYFNEHGDIGNFAASQQTAAFEASKARGERDDFGKDEAIQYLNRLADQIQNCDKDNQLAMHKSMMGSKYSEVQEHAAGNIKNYDPSVQTQAMDAVYSSGNQKAIETAVSNIISSKSTDIIAQECVRYIGEKALRVAIKDNLNERFLSGSLTTKEVSQLSSSQRREYIQQYFKKLPLDQKLKLLSSISNSSMKKTIYTMIARSDSYLFNEICKDKDRADNLLSLGLPEDVNNKIRDIVAFLAVSDVGFQEVAKKYGIEYDGKNGKESQTALTLNNFVSKPISPELEGLKFLIERDKFGEMYING